MMRFLEVKNLCFSYRKDVTVFNDISFKINPPLNKGQIVALMGNSGCGKTTLLKLLLGIETSYTGTINTNPNSAVISYVPQSPVLFDHLSPIENARYFQRIKSRAQSFDEKLYNVLIDTLNLRDLLNTSSSVSELSGGQQQKISLVRALSIRPDYLLLDEPLTGLDSEVKEHFLTKLLEIMHELQLVIIYVSHHVNEVQLISDEVIYLINEAEQPVSSLSHKPIEEFIENPPCISAAKTFKKYNYNIINIRNPNVLPTNFLLCNPYLDEDCYYLGFSEDSMNFVEKGGLEIIIVSQTPNYTLLKTKFNDQFIRIKTKEYKAKNLNGFSCLKIGLKIDQYNYQGMRIIKEDN